MGCKKTSLKGKQLKSPLMIEHFISDPVYTFCNVIDQKLLKVILFAFMENSYCSLREIEFLG